MWGWGKQQQWVPFEKRFVRMVCPWVMTEDLRGMTVELGRPAQQWLERVTGLSPLECQCSEPYGRLWIELGDTTSIQRPRTATWLAQRWGIYPDWAGQPQEAPTAPQPVPAPQPVAAQPAPQGAPWAPQWAPLRPTQPAPQPAPQPVPAIAPGPARPSRAAGEWTTAQVQPGLHDILVDGEMVGRVMRRRDREWVAAEAPRHGTVEHAVCHPTMRDAVAGLRDLVLHGPDAYQEVWEREPVVA